MASTAIKYWLNLVGAGLGIVGIIFVILRLDTHSNEINFLVFEISDLALLVTNSIFFGATNILLALAWWFQLQFLKLNPPWYWALKAYGISQLAKYLPGNIFHLLGRQALGMAYNLPAASLAKSSAWEIGTIVLASMSFTILLIPIIWLQNTILISLVIFLITIVSFYQILKKVYTVDIAKSLFLHVNFLAASGLIFVSILGLVLDQPLSLGLVPSLCGVYVTAWLIGFITPGAPAGLGVREFVALLLLRPMFSEADLLLAILLSRVVTISGDLLFFLISWVLYKNPRGKI